MTIKDTRVDLLNEALLSLEYQTFDDFELVCVCDRDWVASYVEDFCCEWGITLVLEQNQAYNTRAERFNAAVGLAKGMFCAVLDCDDLLHPDALWVLMKCLDKFPCTNWFSGSHVAFVHNTDQRWINKAEPIAQMLSSLSVTFKQRHFWGFRNNPKAWPQGIFCPEHFVEDYQIFAKLAHYGMAVLPIPFALYAWRQHPDQWTVKNRQVCDEMCEVIRAWCSCTLRTQKPYWSLGDAALAARMTRAMVMLENDLLVHPLA